MKYVKGKEEHSKLYFYWNPNVDIGVDAVEQKWFMLRSQMRGMGLGSHIEKYGQLVWGLYRLALSYFNS